MDVVNDVTCSRQSVITRVAIRFLYDVIHWIKATSYDRGYLLFLGEYQLYFIECVEKISVISRVRSMSDIADIFNTWDEIFLVFIKKK